jgi:sodium transport system permease protein
MAIMLTWSPRKTLQLYVPSSLTLPVAVLLALLLHPSIVLLGKGIEILYPLSSDKLQALEPYLAAMREAPLGYVLLLVAALPAVCEELAFRGFILSGLRHMGHKWTAIVLSSVFFGVAHGLLQQSLAAIAVGVIIGYLVVQSGSLLPGVLFHLTHNALFVLAGRITPELIANHPALGWLFQASGDPLSGQFECRWPLALIGGAASLVLLRWLRGLPYQAYAEEQLQQALDRQEIQRPDAAAGM